MYLFEGDFLLRCLVKWMRIFSATKEKKEKLNEYVAKKLLELHQSLHMLVATYKTPPLFHKPHIQRWINTYRFDHVGLKKQIKD